MQFDAVLEVAVLVRPVAEDEVNDPKFGIVRVASLGETERYLFLIVRREYRERD